MLLNASTVLVVIGTGIAVLRIIAVGVEHAEAVCDLRAQVRRLHAEYQARLAGIDTGDVEIIGSIGPQSPGQDPAKTKADS